MMQLPKNEQEFLDLLDQGLFEVQDLISSVEDEGEDIDLGRHLLLYQDIARDLQTLDMAVRAGTHKFASGNDLVCYTIALPIRRRLPIFGLIEAINAAHRRGFGEYAR